MPKLSVSCIVIGIAILDQFFKSCNLRILPGLRDHLAENMGFIGIKHNVEYHAYMSTV